MPNLLVIGSINMDMTVFADRIPKSGETMAGSDFLLSPGGKGANQAVAAARMGANVTMLGAVGSDLFGNTLIEGLSAAGVNTDQIARLDDVSTGIASITVCGGDNRIILYGAANDRVSPEQIDGAESLFQNADAVILQLEIPIDTVVHAVKKAHGLGKRVYLNPAPAKPLPAELYPLVDYLLPNESEAAILLGRALSTDADYLGALRSFRDMGVAHPLITLGERGVACFIDSEPTIVKGYTVKAVDTTAAGDTFIGALAANSPPTGHTRETIDLAHRAAAICVTRPGAQKTIPTLDEVRAWTPDTQQ